MNSKAEKNLIAVKLNYQLLINIDTIIVKKVVFSDLENANLKNYKKMKEIQIEQTMAQIAKQAELKQKHENKSHQQSYMQTKYRSNHKLQAIKEAVESESITVQEANEMIMKQKKQTNS